MATLENKYERLFPNQDVPNCCRNHLMFCILLLDIVMLSDKCLQLQYSQDWSGEVLRSSELNLTENYYKNFLLNVDQSFTKKKTVIIISNLWLFSLRRNISHTENHKSETPKSSISSLDHQIALKWILFYKRIWNPSQYIMTRKILWQAKK